MGNDSKIADAPMARAFAILEYIVSAAKPVAAADIADALGLAPPTAHRLAVQLEHQGYLQRALGSKRFTFGPRLRDIGFNVVRACFQEAPRHAVLQSLANEIGEQCELGIVRDNEVLYVDGVRTMHPIGLHFEPGRHVPLHCTSTGKLFLCQLPKSEQLKVIQSLPLERCTPHTIIDPVSLLRELDLIKKRGYATSNEEYVTGVVGCAVPVLGPRKNILAGLGVSAPAARLPFEQLPKYIPAMQRAAERIAAHIGHEI